MAGAATSWAERIWIPAAEVGGWRDWARGRERRSEIAAAGGVEDAAAGSRRQRGRRRRKSSLTG